MFQGNHTYTHLETYVRYNVRKTKLLKINNLSLILLKNRSCNQLITFF